MLTHVDLCSGMGGFSLACKWAGFKTIAFCEIDKFCQENYLKKLYPGVPIYDDIKIFPGESFPGCTLLTAGIPCQPFSIAGTRKGTADPRYLWRDALKIIQSAKPYWCIIENVAGAKLVSKLWQNDLEASGYDVVRFNIPACAVGAPHKRARLWIIAHRKSERDQREEIYLCKEDGGQDIELPFVYDKSDMGNVEDNKSDRCGIRRSQQPGFEGIPISIGETLPNAQDTLQRERGSRDGWTYPTEAGQRDQNKNSGSALGTIEEHRLLDFERTIFEKAWEIFCVDDGVSDSLCWPRKTRKALGNSIVPQVAYQIIKGIAKYEEGKIIC